MPASPIVESEAGGGSMALPPKFVVIPCDLILTES